MCLRLNLVLVVGLFNQNAKNYIGDSYTIFLNVVDHNNLHQKLFYSDIDIV